LLLYDVRRVLDEMCSSPDGSACCRLAVLLRSEQHVVMPVGGLLFLRSSAVTPRIFAVEFFLFFTRQNSGVTFSFSFCPR
jgi:hypothetical protein